MKSNGRSFQGKLFIALGALSLGLFAQTAWGQYQNKYRIEKSYEDTVRIVVITNETATGNGYCPTGTKPVGPLTRDFVKKSIATVPNVRYFASQTTTWNDITAIQWPGKPAGTLPHAIVHINAGWFSLSGPYIYGILNQAADLKIGVVSIGDDASALAQQVFGFTNTNNVPAPMNDARQFRGNNALWIALDGKDTLPAPGVVRNTADSLNKKILQFKPYPGDNVTTAGNYRCQEDADQYTVAPAFLDKLSFLGYQRAYNGTDTVKTAVDANGKNSPLQIVVAFQDSLRRGVALSYQPEFLLDEEAAHQIDYDAIIYASFAHLFHAKVTVTATPPTAVFNTEQQVFLASDPNDAIIHYTLDGTTIPDSTSPVYDRSKPLTLIQTTKLQTIAYRSGYTKSDVDTFTYTKNYIATKIEILDKDKNPLVGGYLSERDTAYYVRITTYQGGLTQLQPTANTSVSLDKETVTMTTHTSNGDALVFEKLVRFSTPAGAASGDGKTQAAVYDTLTVAWTNPINAADSKSIRVPVRPYPNSGQIYFSTKADGSDRVDQYVGNETKIYVVVVDEVLPAGKPPKVTLTTKPFLAVAGDNEALTTLQPGTPAGTYVFAVNVANPPSAADGNLNVALNDQITATYKDPYDINEPAIVANAGFGIAPLITASLQFTDSIGNDIPVGAKYSPDSRYLYLQFTDDWAGGTASGKLDSLPVTLTIVNYEGKATPDTETVWMRLQPTHQGSTGTWKGKIDLKDYRNIVVRNLIAETYVLGDVTASIIPHDNAGLAESTPVTDRLLVAYQDQTPAISIEGPGGTVVTRADTGIKITIVDQSITSGRDTIYVTLSCGVSGDAVNPVRLIEDPNNPGHYVSEIIVKQEGTPTANDPVLSCKDRDQVKVSYIDPVYKTETIQTVDFSEPVAAQLYYSSDPAGNVHITTVAESDTNSFYIVLLARDPDISKPDQFTVTLKIEGGETETFVAKETGNHTNKFVVQVPFAFVTAVPTVNGTLEGKLSAQNLQNRVGAVGTVTVNQGAADQQERSAPITLIAAFDPITKAYIKDVDGDGAADHIYMVFDRPLPRLPTTVDARWDSTASPAKSTTKFTFLDDSHTTVVADYSAAPFPVGYTSVAPGQDPQVTLQDDPLFISQKQSIEDSIGPVVMTASKRPARPGSTIDTLTVIVSEPIQSKTVLKQMLHFSLSCADRQGSKPIIAYIEPVADPSDPTRYTILVDNTVTWVDVGRCVFLDDGGDITDTKLNPASDRGVRLGGGDAVSAIRLLRGYPPVAGLSPSNVAYQVASNDSRDSTRENGFANPDGKIYWIPPMNWAQQAANVEAGGHYVPPSGSTAGQTDITRDAELPSYISAVQIISTMSYKASISIYDQLGNFVAATSMEFGIPEMANPARTRPKGWLSFLIWDRLDSHGRKAGQGVYVWKIKFDFYKDGVATHKQEIRYVRTGLVRQKQ